MKYSRKILKKFLLMNDNKHIPLYSKESVFFTIFLFILSFQKMKKNLYLLSMMNNYKI